MSRNQSKRSVARTYVLQEKTDLYHMIQNSIVKSLSNMRITVTISQSCKTTRHAITTFLTTPRDNLSCLVVKPSLIMELCITIESFYLTLNRSTEVEDCQDVLDHWPLDCVKGFAKVELEENAWCIVQFRLF